MAQKINAKQGAVVDFTTAEQDTGVKWVDGRTIYRKTIDVGALPNTTSKSVAHGVTPSLVIRAYGHAYNGVVHLPLPYAQVVAANSIGINVTAVNIVIESGADRSTYAGFVTIEYVKP